MVRNAFVALTLIAALLPQSASAKTMLGTLRHGTSDIQFVLAGNQLVVEQVNARGIVDAIGVPLKAAGCPQLAGHTLTIRTQGAVIEHSTSDSPYNWVFDPKKRDSASFVYDPSEERDAAVLVGKINPLVGCR